MPDVSGGPVVTNARAFYTTRAAAGALSARHFLRPLSGEEQTILKSSRKSCGENDDPHLVVPAQATRSQGRRNLIIDRLLTRLFLSTCGRGDLACPSSGGAARRYCRRRRRAP